MTKKVFISQPMRDLSDEDIQRVRSEALVYAQHYLNDEVREIPSYFEENKSMSPVECLGASIKLMGMADLVVFAQGWEEARGCRIEHMVAIEYDLPVKEI